MNKNSFRECKRDYKNCMDKNNNCPFLGKDGNLVQCVGVWSKHKYDYLERYLKTSERVRNKFYTKGNAVFIDLFSGPGKSVIRFRDEELNSSSLIAGNLQKYPFNNYYFVDISTNNCESLKYRLKDLKNSNIILGDSNKKINEIILNFEKKKELFKYFFIFIDPFSPEAFKFSTIGTLIKVKKHLDIMMHFPIGAIRRNFNFWLNNNSAVLDDFLGTDKWKFYAKKSNNIFEIVYSTFVEQLKKLGFPEEGLGLISNDGYWEPTLANIINRKNVVLYQLIIISKNSLAQKMWKGIIKKDSDGKTKLF